MTIRNLMGAAFLVVFVFACDKKEQAIPAADFERLKQILIDQSTGVFTLLMDVLKSNQSKDCDTIASIFSRQLQEKEKESTQQFQEIVLFEEQVKNDREKWSEVEKVKEAASIDIERIQNQIKSDTSVLQSFGDRCPDQRKLIMQEVKAFKQRVMGKP